MQIYTKETLIEKLEELSEKGWVPNARHGNVGGIGNTLEDFLGISENNLPLANAAEWELKAQRAKTTALTTLLHIEPSPTTLQFVVKMLLPFYGWPHKEAGSKHPASEMNFHQTIHARSHSDRGFIVKFDRVEKKVLISFDASKVSSRHDQWLRGVERKIGLGELDPQPYWGFDDLEHKIGAKLTNCFYVKAEVKKREGKEYYLYNKVQMLQTFRFEGLLSALEQAVMLVDFNARTHKNHGTHFRLRQNQLPLLYDKVTTIID